MEVSLGCIIVLNFCRLQELPDKCYDRIPILFDRTTESVDPITRQTYDFASETPCLGVYTNVFQLDLENDNSSNQLYLIPCLLINLCCSIQLSSDILLSFLLSTLGAIGCTLPSK